MGAAQKGFQQQHFRKPVKIAEEDDPTLLGNQGTHDKKHAMKASAISAFFLAQEKRARAKQIDNLQKEDVLQRQRHVRERREAITKFLNAHNFQSVNDKKHGSKQLFLFAGS